MYLYWLENAMILLEILFILLHSAVTVLLSCFYMLSLPSWLPYILIPWFIGFNIIPVSPLKWIRLHSDKLRNIASGTNLLKIFLCSVTVNIVFGIMGLFGKLTEYGVPGFGEEKMDWVLTIIAIILIENIVFWNGIVRIYISSTQLGARFRLLGALCGMIPIVHLVVLGILIYISDKEVRVENKKIQLNESRKDQQICACKYPILMVHGVFFRDFRYMNYWGRIPEQLEMNGAKVFYGNQQSAASVLNCGRELAQRIKEVCEQTGSEKVNIIAHSKGGLDTRMAIAKFGAGPYIASVTTINTPHRGCEFADYLLSKIGEKHQVRVAGMYEAALRKLGDPTPNFLAAVNDLTSTNCAKLNEEMPDPEGIYCQSVGSKLNHAVSGRFPLNFSTLLVHHFDGPNDGLVGAKSFCWGQDYQFLTVKGLRGISHGDMIDLNRENIDDFDVREFYVQLVSDLKKKGF